MDPLNPLDEARPRWAVVTGAAGGIGRALVEAFTADGCRVLAVDLAPRPPGLTCEHYLQADLQRTVEEESYAGEVFARMVERFGGSGLSVLVNNAAVQVLGGLQELTREQWHRTLNTNLLAPFVWTQALLPHLASRRGCVVNISSIHARLTKPGFMAYATSKAALSGLTRAMAVDVGPKVRVLAIEPAAIETDMLRAGFVGREEAFEALRGCHPGERIGSPREVARLAVMASRDDVGFLHGSCIAMDGGISGRLHDPE